MYVAPQVIPAPAHIPASCKRNVAARNGRCKLDDVLVVVTSPDVVRPPDVIVTAPSETISPAAAIAVVPLCVKVTTPLLVVVTAALTARFVFATTTPAEVLVFTAPPNVVVPDPASWSNAPSVRAAAPTLPALTIFKVPRRVVTTNRTGKRHIAGPCRDRQVLRTIKRRGECHRAIGRRQRNRAAKRRRRRKLDRIGRRRDVTRRRRAAPDVIVTAPSETISPAAAITVVPLCVKVTTPLLVVVTAGINRQVRVLNNNTGRSISIYRATKRRRPRSRILVKRTKRQGTGSHITSANNIQSPKAGREPPTAPVNVTLPVPAVIVRFCAPLSVEANVTAPLADASATAPPSVVADANWIASAVVVMSPDVVVPLPDVIVTAPSETMSPAAAITVVPLCVKVTTPLLVVVTAGINRQVRVLNNNTSRSISIHRAAKRRRPRSRILVNTNC